jgi:hypothetical protein
MALSKQQEALFKLKLQNDPEFQTGFYKSPQTIEQMGLYDLFKAPVGPLRYVDEVPGSESFFDEGDFDIDAYKVPTVAGPLRDVDPQRTAGIIQALEAKDPTGELVKNYVKSIEMTDDGIFQKVDQNPIPTKFAEFQPVPYSELQKKLTTPVYNINPTSKAGVYGYTPFSIAPEKYGTEFIDKSKPVYLAQDLVDFITTKPMSPANQLPLFTSQAAMLGMYGAKPEDFMRKAIETVQHEYAHNITKFPQFKNIIKDAVNIDIPSNLKLKGKDGLSIRDLEELFTRAIDIERVYRKTGDINDPLVDIDLQYMQSVLDKKYKKDKDNPYDYSSAISYINTIRPTVVNYFNKIEEIVRDQSLPPPKAPRQPTTRRPIAPTTGGGGSPAQMAKTAAETRKKDLQKMRGPIGRDDPAPTRSQNVARTASRVGPGGRVRAYGLKEGGRVGYALGSPEPLNVSNEEKRIAFDLYQALKDIEEQYTGETIAGDPSPQNLDPSDRRQGTLMADATTELDQAPDSFLRPRRYDIIEGKELPAETLEDFDVMFRKPNATGGRVNYENGDIVNPPASMMVDTTTFNPIPEDAARQKINTLAKYIAQASVGDDEEMSKGKEAIEFIQPLLKNVEENFGTSREDVMKMLREELLTFMKPKKAAGGRVKLGSGAGVIDYGKKYLKYKDRPTQERLNKIIEDLREGGAMSADAALDLALKQIREE